MTIQAKQHKRASHNADESGQSQSLSSETPSQSKAKRPRKPNNAKSVFTKPPPGFSWSWIVVDECFVNERIVTYNEDDEPIFEDHMTVELQECLQNPDYDRLEWDRSLKPIRKELLAQLHKASRENNKPTDQENKTVK